MAISKRVRYEVLRRDGTRCRYCGASATDGATLTIDHVVPVALGGSDDPTNLAAACRDCNSGKTSTTPDAPLVADVTADSIRYAEAMRKIVADLDADATRHREYRDTFVDAWTDWVFGPREKEAPLTSGWENAVLSWQASGVTLSILKDAIEIAMKRTAVAPDAKFAYLCGIMRNKLAEIHEKARELVVVEDEDPFECYCEYSKSLALKHGFESVIEHASDRDCELFGEGEGAGVASALIHQSAWNPLRLLEYVVDGRELPGGTNWAGNPTGLRTRLWVA